MMPLIKKKKCSLHSVFGDTLVAYKYAIYRLITSIVEDNIFTVLFIILFIIYL